MESWNKAGEELVLSVRPSWEFCSLSYKEWDDIDSFNIELERGAQLDLPFEDNSVVIIEKGLEGPKIGYGHTC